MIGLLVPSQRTVGPGFDDGIGGRLVGHGGCAEIVSEEVAEEAVMFIRLTGRLRGRSDTLVCEGVTMTPVRMVHHHHGTGAH